ncbi:PREDICTED: nurim homolog [Ceratosolen solmsi marchali]|uniref:Nuclear envelope membrane protein n=1 Tax=Ceratosolen solmsi marchali TaxID=326594 RepID=A0AAJ6VMM7_9HYME|nr:PREDICTED: nurim homolog [Ceratosolen solmsi marchali]
MLLKLFRISICISSFLYTFYVLCNFTYFLSKLKTANHELQQGLILKTLWILLLNTSLLSIFILQHSVMASDIVKDFYYKFNIEDIERSVFNMSSAAVLHFLMSTWQSIPWSLIWNFNIDGNDKMSFVISFLHFTGWLIVYTGCVMMDISELAGIKQVYYKISGRPRPMAMKSRELQRYFMHMRHPSFSGFLIILWVYPVMTIDRFILASLLTVYMILMWTIDQDDYNYHSIIISRKERELGNKMF